MRLIDADELITAFPCGESVRTESVRATINHMPTIDAIPSIEVDEDCISRGKLISDLAGIWEDGYTPNLPRTLLDFQDMLEDINYKIRNAPPVVPKPKEGEWIVKANGNNECSICGREKQNGWVNFCGFCGAKMKGADDE